MLKAMARFASHARYLRVALGVALTVMVLPVASEFFVRLAEEKGLYDRPSETVGIVIVYITYFTSIPYFYEAFLILIGLFAGAWADHILKRLDFRAKPESAILSDINIFSGNQSWISPDVSGSTPSDSRIWNAAGIKNVKETESDDFDLIYHSPYLRGMKSDDGTDIWGGIQFRNRGRKTLFIKHVSSSLEIETRPPTPIGAPGLQSSIFKETTQTVQFRPVRLYDPKTIRGKMHLYLSFGESKSHIRCGIRINITFDKSMIPSKKGSVQDLDFSFESNISYVIGEPD